MNKKLILLIVGLTAGLLIVLLALQSVRQRTEEAPPGLEGRSSGSIEISEESAPQIQNDKETLLKILNREGIDNENFRVFYNEADNTFTAQIYVGEREEQIERIYEHLGELGITYPRKLPLEFVGPFDYEDYILTE